MQFILGMITGAALLFVALVIKGRALMKRENDRRDAVIATVQAALTRASAMMNQALEQHERESRIGPPNIAPPKQNYPN